LGNFDLANGMDDVYVGVTPLIPAPGTAALLGIGGLAVIRRQR
jgi:uncharacterized protein YpuA (DUF1002 family)